ncbi:AraC-type DNA-binding protein [Sphingomonas gellani]|uniref:AraC-type DNA-binding protein n=1 Tax=Sphingomonas gellani TaxID=1166340 RepID=A0A1H8IA56_9SPHN|nr:helix-turn-helix domain-containing protein [Sphingomonas gellani]SEN65077.1 AraC-type DNA-binding protein [Sphingomonas gellani]
MPDRAGATPATPVVTRIRTDGVAPALRTSLLSDELARRLTSGQARVLDGSGGHPDLDWLNVDLGGGLVLASGRIIGLDVERDARLLRGDDDDDCTLFVALTDHIRFEQNDRRVMLRRGDGLFVAHGRPVRSWWHNDRFLLVRLPRGVLGPIARVEQAGGVHLPAHGEAMMLLRPYLATLMRRAQGGEAASMLARRQIGELVGRAIHDALDGSGVLGRAALNEARLCAMIATIEARYADPTLTMRDAAAAAHVSLRSAYLLFASRGLDFGGLLRSVRLDRAIERLHHGGAAGDRILDIALAVGFSDLSHFNRTFRARFGCTPGEARAR